MKDPENRIFASQDPRSAVFGCICWLFALVPLAVLVFLVKKYGVDLPTWDHWDYIPKFRPLFEGDLPFRAAWSQSNEHRGFFANIIQCDLAWLTGWNVLAELALDVVLAVGIFAVVVQQIRLTERRLGGCKMTWLVPVSALIIFSLNQWENWLWGAQVVVFFQVFSTALCLFHLSNFPSRWSDFFRALAMGVIGSYSFGSGLLVWPIGLLILLFVPFDGARKRKMLLWGGAGAAVIFFYLRDFRLPAPNSQFEFAFQHFSKSFAYFFIFLGTAVVNFDLRGALSVGLAGMAGLCLTTFFLMKVRRLKLEALAPYLAFALYAVGSGLMLVVMRSVYGEVQATSPRYIIHSNFFWISFCALLSLTFAGDGDPAGFRGRIPRFSGAAILGVLIFFSVKSSMLSAKEFPARKSFMTAASVELRRFENRDILLRLYPNLDSLKLYVEFLKKYRLSAFRNG